MKQTALVGGVGAIVAGFAFWPTLDDNFWKFLVVVIPTTISLVSSIIGSWSKLNEALVKQIASMLEAKLQTATDAEIQKIRAEMEHERGELVKRVVDEVWLRIDIINKLKAKTVEEPFDVQTLGTR